MFTTLVAVLTTACIFGSPIHAAFPPVTSSVSSSADLSAGGPPGAPAGSDLSAGGPPG